MYLSYSGYKTYISCPLSYWHKYVGKTEMPPDNRVNALYGSAVGALFEAFYNETIWQHGSETASMLLTRVLPTIQGIIEKESKKGVFDWENKKSNYHNLEAVVEDVRIAVRNGLKIIKEHRLLGPVARAEVVLDSVFGGCKIGGRADFIIERTEPTRDTLILDGKGSKYRDRFVDGTQLRWYAMLYHKTTGKLPDKLGFVYWRSPPNDAVDFIEFGPVDLRILQEDVLRTMDVIQLGVKTLGGEFPVMGRGPFQPIPEVSRCKLCSYEPLCRNGRTGVTTFVEDGDDFILT